jgi:hypothetical protein
MMTSLSGVTPSPDRHPVRRMAKCMVCDDLAFEAAHAPQLRFRLSELLEAAQSGCSSCALIREGMHSIPPNLNIEGHEYLSLNLQVINTWGRGRLVLGFRNRSNNGTGLRSFSSLREVCDSYLYDLQRRPSLGLEAG